MITLIFITFLVLIFYYFVRIHYKYWEKRGVSGPKPSFLVGNLGQSFILKAQPGEIYADIYKKFNNHSIVGIYKSFTPTLLIRDPELIKEVTIKSFNHFHDNDIPVDKKHDALFGRNPFVLKGEEWKVVRAQLTPGFTSGKIKWLYPYLETNSQKLVQFIGKTPEATNGDGYEAKELCTRFTLNNVGDAVFGIEAKCFDSENSEFRQLAREFLTPGNAAVIKMFVVMIFPLITKIMAIRFTTEQIEKKLTDIVTQALQHRKDNNIVRNDFLHIISQLKTTCKDYEFTDVDVTAHAAGFFADGYETSSIVMSLVLYNLSANKEVQEKLREEVEAAFEGNSLSYEAVQGLQYLDGVINETLRVNPPVYFLQKLCTQTYTYVPKETNKPVVIEKGTPIILPIYGLHYDPEHFENPEEFKPERFVGSNRDNIKKCTFLPFGEGPRACLGQRFGVLQVKIGVCYLIRNYELTVNKKTQLPLKFDPTNFLLTPIGGLWIDFKKIKLD